MAAHCPATGIAERVATGCVADVMGALVPPPRMRAACRLIAVLSDSEPAFGGTGDNIPHS